MDEVAVNLRITGRVQGVWYRGWAVDNAIALGLRGWVRNRFDGSVEAFNKAVASLERSDLPGARKFVELGVQARKEIVDLEPIETGTRPVPADEE